MKAIRATIADGQIMPEEVLNMNGRHDAIVVVLDADPWDAILADPRPRPELVKARQEAEREFLEGKTMPLDPDAMQ